ncbi:MAG: hypothetical protein IMX00_03525 [Limnochordales bacterium]|nr:hypothetical protein [Limnochordales bacterium]
MANSKPEFLNPQAINVAPASAGPDDPASDRDPYPNCPLPDPPGLVKERRIKDDGRYIIFYWEEGSRPHV